MTQFSKITPGFFAAPQLSKQDIARAATLGFRTIINNRPDGEAEDQLSAEEARQAAEKHGMAYLHLPVRGFQITDEDNVLAFVEALSNSREPVLAYCKSGTRSAMLWAQALAGRIDVEDILWLSAKAGFDLDILAEELEDIAAQSKTRKAA